MSEMPTGKYSDLDIAIMLVAVPVAVLIAVASKVIQIARLTKMLCASRTSCHTEVVQVGLRKNIQTILFNFHHIVQSSTPLRPCQLWRHTEKKVFSFLKERNERKMRSEQSEREQPTNEYGSLNVHRISTNMRTDNQNQTTNANTTSSMPQPIQSDYEIIFGSTPVASESITSIYSRRTDLPITAAIHELEEQRHLSDMLNDYERRAQERRDVLTNSSALHMPLYSINFSLHEHTTDIREIFPTPEESPENEVFDGHPLPRYISEDYSLPSYEQAVLDESDIKRH